MPKLIVYVKADTWRRVQQKAGGDGAALARAISVEAIEKFVEGATITGEHRTATSDTDGAAPPPGVQAVPTGKEKEVGTPPFNPDEDALPSPSAKPRKRLHPCKHHVPPHRVCDYCDV